MDSNKATKQHEVTVGYNSDEEGMPEWLFHVLRLSIKYSRDTIEHHIKS